MKKMWKNAVALMCTIIFVLTSVLPVQVFAENSESDAMPRVTLGDTSLYVGDETYVTIPLTLNNNTGLLGLLLEVSYPAELTYQGLAQGTALSELTMTESGDEMVDPSFCLLWDGVDLTDTSNGTLAQLSFIVPTDAATEYEISVTVLDARNEMIESVSVMTQNGVIEVSELETYGVIYDLTGGEGEIPEQTKVMGETLILSDVVPVREGFVFQGWATQQGGLVTYAPGDAYIDDAECTLYAVWEANTYEIAFDANGGENAPETQIKTYGVDITLRETTPVWVGHTFNGWAMEPDGPVIYTPGATYTENKSATLYAIWEAITYAVTYNAAGGNNAPVPQMKTYGVSLTLSSEIPVRDGYTFMGWSTVPGGTVELTPGGQYTENAPVTLYAVWEANTYEIAFDANGGENAPETQIKTYGIDITLRDTIPVWVGHTFNGWATEPDGPVIYAPGATYTENKSATLYAVWDVDTYDVIFDADGGENAPVKQIKTYGFDLALSDSVPTRNGYVFKGWAREKNGTPVYQPGDWYTDNSGVTLYAVWEIETYIVTYDAGGGEGAPDNQVKTYGVDLTLSSVIPTREGHTFRGWATERNGAVVYSAGAVYTANSGTALYAVWDINTYNIMYDATGGENAPAKQEKTYGVDLTLSSVIPTKAGHTFKGWATEAEGDVIYAAGATYAANEGVTLYAVWEIETYDITYDANGGEGAPDNQVKTYGVDLTLSSVLPTREGHTFRGWATERNGAVVYSAGATYTANEGVTLYAVWDIHTYDIMYDATGGENAPAKQVKTYGVDLTLSSVLPSREGYTFKGWATEAEGEVVYPAGAVYTANEGVTLYAVWEIETYIVTYDADGGEDAPQSQVKTYGIALTLSDRIPVKAGHTFLGWATERNGAVTYEAGATYVDNSGVTLYAVWQAHTYDIVYDATGGAGAPVKQTKTYGENLTLSDEIPVREGYIFKGWATEAEGAVCYDAGATYTTDAPVTLYAVWEVKTYIVSYMAENADNCPEEQIKTHGEALFLSDVEPMRAGYLFMGWSTVENGDVTYLPGDVYELNEDVTLYAVFEIIRVAPITSLKLAATKVKLHAGTTFALYDAEKVLPVDHTDIIIWSSSNETVAIVDENGVVTAIRKGTAKITAQSTLGSKKATCTITVNPMPEWIEITGDSAVAKGKSITLKAYAYYLDTDGDETKTKDIIFWRSLNEDVASVSSKGKVTGNNAGVATIVAYIEGLDLEATIDVSVVIPATKLKFESSKTTVYLGNELNLAEKLTVTPEDNTDTILWTSSKESVATVDPETGVVTPVSKGTARITAKSVGGKKSASVTVTVAPMPEWIEITGDTAVAKGKSITLKAYAYYRDEDGDSVKTKDTVLWRSSDETIATVTEKGKVVGVGAGRVTIVAYIEGLDLEATIDVSVVIPATKLKFESSKTTVYLGNELNLADKLTVTPEDNTDTIIWTSSKPSVATVDPETGVVTPVSKGTARITAKSVGGKKSASVTVTVAPMPEWIEITGDSAVAKGKYITLKAYAYYTDEDGDAVKTKDKVLWRSSDETIATVTEKGKVVGVGAGRVTITAYIEGTDVNRTFDVFVAENPVTRLSFASTRANASVDDVIDLAEQLSVTDRENDDIFTWTSSKESVATVDANGVVTVVGIGTAKITVRAVAGKKSAYVTITVK